MKDDEEIIVQIEPDEQPSAADKKPEDESIEIVRAQVKEYEKKLEDERAEKEAARQRAEAAEREAAHARTKVSESEIDVLASAMSVAEVERENAKRELKDAMERGDFDGVVSANEKLSLAVSNMEKLKEGKVALERSKTEKAPSGDPVEGYISRFTPRSQDFLRKNIDLVKDPAKNKRLIAAHYEAEAEGYVPDSDAYFEFIESKVGKAAPPSRSKSVPAAPVSRGQDITSGGQGEDSAVIKLSPGEARAATDGSIVWNSGPKKGEPIGVKEYARRKSIMMKSGQYDVAS